MIAAVLAYVDENTSHLDAEDIVETLKNLPPSSSFSLNASAVQTVYTILRYAPMEYLPKKARVDLTKKAVVFDGQLISTHEAEPVRDHLMGVLSLSREYISRSLEHAVAFDKMVQ